VKFRRHLISIFIAAAASITQAQTASEYFEDASRLASEGDVDGAIVQLKNSLQLDPQYIPALLLAGETYLSIGEPREAELLLSDAMMSGADRGHVVLLLAQSYIHQRKFAELLNQLPLDRAPASIVADLRGYHAQALVALGRQDKARQMINDGLAAAPDNLELLLADINLMLMKSRLEQAFVAAERLQQDHGQDSRVKTVYAFALHRKGQYERAVEAYQQAIALDGHNTEARVTLAGLLLDLNRLDEASRELAYLSENVPFEPRAAYFRSVVAARQGDLEKQRVEAKTAVDVLDSLHPSTVAHNSVLLMVGGRSHYTLGEFDRARDYLQSYVRKNPGNLDARLLLGAVMLNLEEYRQVIHTLTPAIKYVPDDARLYGMLAAAYGRQGDPARASELLQRIKGAGTGGVPTDYQLALSWLELGESERGLELLAQVNKAQPDSPAIAVALVRAYQQARQYGNAETALAPWLERLPANLEYRHLHGVNLKGLGQVEQAKAIFERIQTEAPDYLPARLSLAELYLQEKGFEAARAHIAQAAEDIEEAPELQFALARLEMMEGNLDAAVREAESVVLQAPEWLDARRLLIRIYLARQEFDSAKNQARDAVAVWDRSMKVQALLGQTLAAAGERDEALLVYARMVKDAGFDTVTLYRIALLQAAVGDYKAARFSLYKALEGDAEHGQANEAYIRMHLALEEYEDAVELAQAHVNRVPDSLTAQLLLGEAYLMAGRVKDSEQAYRDAIKRWPAERAATLGLYRALAAQDKNKEAEALLVQSLDQGDSGIRMQAVYANLLVRESRWTEAREVLDELLDQRPDFVPFLNNQAYVLQQLGDERALDIARRAHAGAPFNPMVNDTLGWILVESGNPAEGIGFLREAVARASDSEEVRYHLAVALFQLGRHAEAWAELKRALASGKPFAGVERARQLQRELMKN
jgi:putative PEP-CTERM system TPR-repeat lipoprotein